jgi:hypothetical protein
MCSYVSKDLVLVPQAVEEARVALLILALVVLQAEDGQRGRHGVAQVVDQELFWPAVIDAEPVRPEAHIDYYAMHFPSSKRAMNLMEDQKSNTTFRLRRRCIRYLQALGVRRRVVGAQARDKPDLARTGVLLQQFAPPVVLVMRHGGTYEP